MTNWLHQLAHDWDVLLAILLVYVAVGIYLGPAWYFLLWYVSLCGFVIRTALKR